MKKKFILAAAVLFILSGAAAIHSTVSAAAPASPYNQETGRYYNCHYNDHGGHYSHHYDRHHGCR